MHLDSDLQSHIFYTPASSALLLNQGLALTTLGYQLTGLGLQHHCPLLCPVMLFYNYNLILWLLTADGQHPKI